MLRSQRLYWKTAFGVDQENVDHFKRIVADVQWDGKVQGFKYNNEEEEDMTYADIADILS